ncbi:hypothetical protein ADUPG1_006438 [Aduncisulcus paluster]|uniref:Thioredoxin domain-containing protein n=1 Tax=Aduncisulcus paluster TaxID=2918883 RepID=A0ABQ5KMT2_9EUKA|nr:hypothetical protein ADUPG1_006438 [Aduncisulcus paluster]
MRGFNFGIYFTLALLLLFGIVFAAEEVIFEEKQESRENNVFLFVKHNIQKCEDSIKTFNNVEAKYEGDVHFYIVNLEAEKNVELEASEFFADEKLPVIFALNPTESIEQFFGDSTNEEHVLDFVTTKFSAADKSVSRKVSSVDEIHDIMKLESMPVFVNVNLTQGCSRCGAFSSIFHKAAKNTSIPVVWAEIECESLDSPKCAGLDIDAVPGAVLFLDNGRQLPYHGINVSVMRGWIAERIVKQDDEEREYNDKKAREVEWPPIGAVPHVATRIRVEQLEREILNLKKTVLEMYEIIQKMGAKNDL